MSGKKPVSLETLDSLQGVDALCLFIAEDERPLRGVAGFLDWRLCGKLSAVLKDGFFKGEQDEWLLLPSLGRVAPGKIFAMGLGPGGKLDRARVEKALADAAAKLKKARVSSVALEAPYAEKLSQSERAEALDAHFVKPFGGAAVTVLVDSAA